MNTDYPLDYEPATPQFVLALFQRGLKKFLPSNDGLRPEYWHLDMPFDQWNDECHEWLDDDFFPSMLIWLLRDEFDIDLSLPDVEWKFLWEEFFNDPPQKLTLGHFCAVLARHLRVPRMRAWPAVGRPCASAGAFLTIRSLMAESGADVSDLRPSTPLEDFARRNWSALESALKTAAPLARPHAVVVKSLRQHVHDAFRTLEILGLGGAVILAFFALFAPQKVGAQAWTFLAVAVVCWKVFEFFHPLAWLTSGGVPAKVSLGPLRTFRDLSDYLAGKTA